ncbi:threonine--tRNA ligase, mitochondrial 1 [Rutidosis leptorrhynchoides]|uniref:threonine--tRNA ligase, mitochondrial 1 n=1 Tax=Rutidosis leptorrhynchoides TaxID=125765 RepID=UPI003A990955
MNLMRNLQFATIQLDFQLPLHFNLTYSAEIETTWERPIMIRASIFRSFKSMFDILFEHCKGKWPFWLSCQAIVCPVSNEYKAYGEQTVKHQVVAAGYYADMDYSYRTIEEKVLKAQLAQYNYILVAGEEEATTGKVSVQVRDKKEPLVLTIQDLIEHFKEEVDNFH